MCESLLYTYTGPYVVYGSGIDAFSAVNQLLVNQVSPDSITMLQPIAPSHWATELVRDRVYAAAATTGVHTITGLTLTEWLVGEEGLHAVVIETATGHAQTVPCKTMIYLGDKAVDSNVFKGVVATLCICMCVEIDFVCLCPALNDACLVFDSRLVITSDHCTNDPLILAAGPLTKYSRKYRVNNW